MRRLGRAPGRVVRRYSVALVVAGVGLVTAAAPAGAIELPIPTLPTLPLPTTTTNPPTTTTTAAPTTTTTRAPTTTTTRPEPTTTTTRPKPPTTTTTRTRRTPTTTGAAGPGAPVGAVTNARGTSSTSRAAVRDRRRRLPVAEGPIAGSQPPGSSPVGGGPATQRSGGPDPSGGGDRTIALGRTTATSSGMSDVLDAMPGPLVLAGVIAALVVTVAVLARLRARDPFLRAARLGGGTLVVERDDAEPDVADRLVVAVRSGPVRVVGRDCRGLQLLVKVVALHGLEVVDADGDLVRASRRLVRAKDLVSDRRRLPLSWSVRVERPTVAVVDGWNLRSAGSADGRVLSFAPGTSLMLWDGDVLR